MMKKLLKILLCVFMVGKTILVNVKADTSLIVTAKDVYNVISTVSVDKDGNVEIHLSLSTNEIKNLSRETIAFIVRTIGDDILNKNQSNMKGRPEYYNVYGDAQRKVFEGYAGNQPTGGTMFPTGGGFYWSDYNGPSISIGIGFQGLGGFFDSLPVSVSIGKSGSSGRFVNVPTTTDYYKLYIEKEYDCTPYITYCRQPDGTVTVYGRAVMKLYVSDVAYAKKV